MSGITIVLRTLFRVLVALLLTTASVYACEHLFPTETTEARLNGPDFGGQPRLHSIFFVGTILWEMELFLFVGLFLLSLIIFMVDVVKYVGRHLPSFAFEVVKYVRRHVRQHFREEDRQFSIMNMNGTRRIDCSFNPADTVEQLIDLYIGETGGCVPQQLFITGRKEPVEWYNTAERRPYTIGESNLTTGAELVVFTATEDMSVEDVKTMLHHFPPVRVPRRDNNLPPLMVAHLSRTRGTASTSLSGNSQWF